MDMEKLKIDGSKFKAGYDAGQAKIKRARNIHCSAPPCSVAVQRAVENCHRAGVTKVKPAIHHGCLRFLMAREGYEENLGGIVYSANDYSLKRLKTLADEVNLILSQNSKDYHGMKGEARNGVE